MTKQVRRTMGCITLKKGNRVVGKTTEIFGGKRLIQNNILHLGCQSCH
jgi:hypothetical protein